MKRFQLVTHTYLALISATFLASSFSQAEDQALKDDSILPVYLRSSVGHPWDDPSNDLDMDLAFGSGQWDGMNFETADSAELFSTNRRFIYLDGSDNGADELEVFLEANGARIETWVKEGGVLFVNAAPNEGDGMYLGFGMELVRESIVRRVQTAVPVDLSHPIFAGPHQPVGTRWSGDPNYTQATVRGSATPIIVNETNQAAVVAEVLVGNGRVLFGSLTRTSAHTPETESRNLKANLLCYGNALRSSGTILYSNIHYRTLIDGQPTHSNAAGKKTEVAAQPFKTGASGTISIRIPFFKVGSPSGTGRFDLWDDNNGQPGKKLAVVGEFDFDMMVSYPAGQLLTFEKAVTGLEPNTTHHLMLNLDGAVIRGLSNTYGLPTTSSSEGTGGAGKVLINRFGGTVFTPTANLFGANYNYMQMEVIEPSVEEVVSNDLRIATTEDGEVAVSPEMENYPAGTEVTLTATPDPGYEFAGWIVERTERETATVYDNIDHSVNIGLRPLNRDTLAAQQFLMNGHSTLSQVGLLLNPYGTNRGTLAFELWSDNGSDLPKDKIADIGLIADVATMPSTEKVYTFTPQIAELDPAGKYWVVLNYQGITSTPSKTNNIEWEASRSREGSGGATVPHAVDVVLTEWTDLERFNGKSTLRMQMQIQTLSEPVKQAVNMPVENPLTFVVESGMTVSPTFVETTVDLPLIINTTEDGAVTSSPDMENYPVGTEVTVKAQPEQGFEFVKWTYGDEEFTTNPATITIKEGATLAPIFVQVVSGDVFVAPLEGGLYTVTPDLENYPVGSEVSVMAEPEEGFEFVKWTYGNEEFTTNPASITLKARATLTPVFAKKAAEPINIDIAPAMAISWDSQSGKTYEIQSSTDLENWVIEVEGIEGTGETSTHFFFRTASEIYYRVAETQ